MRIARKSRLGAILAGGVTAVLVAVRLRSSSFSDHARDFWTWVERFSWFAGIAALVAAVLALRAPYDASVIDAKQRKILLNRVRRKWISEILEPSLANAARLVLGLERNTALLDLGGRAVWRAGRPGELLPKDTTVSSIFDESGSSLLIAGGPGSGKTTALLELCDALLKRANIDRDEPVPVVANLASWADRRDDIEAWVVEELTRSYLIPRQMAARMLTGGKLTLLLDGLDEVPPVHRAVCVEAINLWRLEHGLVPLAVCGRTAELKALESRLFLDDAVELVPPSDEQINYYLEQLQKSGTPVDELRTALRTDEEMRQLLRSPLMLHVVALAYHGRDAAALRRPGSVAERQDRLWAAYVARMFEQRPVPAAANYTAGKAVAWLAALARTLQQPRALSEVWSRGWPPPRSEHC